MGRLEMDAAVRDLVVFDDNEAGYESVQSEVIEDEMRDCAFAFLVRGVCRLEQEDGLCEDEEATGV